jgi:hypothetical protein
VEWVPVCAAVEIGLPVPRESIRLVEMLKDDPTPNPEIAWMLAVVLWPISTRLTSAGV